MLFKVGIDTINYIAIFLICCFGFGICFMGLFPEIDQFSTSSLTFFTMFDYGMGGYDQLVYDNSPYKNVGKLLTMIYVVFTLIVIFNLLIARMADTYSKIDERSFYQWAKALAKNGRNFMLLQERSPLCMLPPPLNILPSCVYPFHFASIRSARAGLAKKLRPPKQRTTNSAAIEFKKKELLKLKENDTPLVNVMPPVTCESEHNTEVIQDAQLYAPQEIAEMEYFTLSIAGTLSDWVLK
jgi:hypothetical protein